MWTVDAYGFQPDAFWLISIIQASTELAATYAALILADDGVDITVCYFTLHSRQAHLTVSF